MNSYIKAFIGGSTLFLIDRITKIWALSACAHPIFFSPFAACSLCFNSGSCWNFIAGTSQIEHYFLCIIVSIIIAIVMYQIYYKIQLHQPIWPEIFIVAGAVGNLYDRFVFGGVIDFILLFYRDFYWPVFNCADCFVVMGIIVLLIQNCFPHKKFV